MELNVQFVQDIAKFFFRAPFFKRPLGDSFQDYVFTSKRGDDDGGWLPAPQVLLHLQCDEEAVCRVVGGAHWLTGDDSDQLIYVLKRSVSGQTDQAILRRVWRSRREGLGVEMKPARWPLADFDCFVNGCGDCFLGQRELLLSHLL